MLEFENESDKKNGFKSVGVIKEIGKYKKDR